MFKLKFIWYTKLAVFIITALAAGIPYNHSFSTFELSFSTPNNVTADVNWNLERHIIIDLDTGENLVVLPKNLNNPQQEFRENTNENLKRLWTDYIYESYFDPAIIKIDNGDFIVFGRLISGSRSITRVMRTFDFDGDDIFDYRVFWDTCRTIDYEKIKYLANTTNIYLSN